MPDSFAGGKPYLEARGGHVDGIGTEHWQLYARCARCDEKFHVANVHGPLGRSLAVDPRAEKLKKVLIG